MRTKKTQSEILQGKVEEYKRSHNASSVDLDDVAIWLLREGWQPKPRDARKLLRRELSRALRQEYMTDPQGRRIRRNHAEQVSNHSGEDKTANVLWHDITTATRPQMQAAFQQRRHGIVMDCHQLKADVDSYNRNFNTSEVPIQMVFDFMEDLEELEQEHSDTTSAQG